MEMKKWRMSRKMTVGQWLQRVICDLRNPSRLKPTSNYQVYQSLYNKLLREGSILSMPVKNVNDRTFRRLIKWMGSKPNYEGTLKTFTALINRAHRARLTRYRADFPYRDFAPKTSRRLSGASAILSSGGTVNSLSLSQWHEFLSMQLEDVPIKDGPKMHYWKEVYRDFCILLYELKSRPIDVLQLHSSSLAFHSDINRTLCSYVPAKKANRNDPAIQFLSPAACELVERYKGKSKGGYIFPFPINQRRWNLESPAQFNEHYRLARNQLAKINRFLHLVGKKLELPFPFTLYVIRRSAITHAIIENRIPLTVLAKMAGTSVRMIEKHYTNYLHTIAEY